MEKFLLKQILFKIDLDMKIYLRSCLFLNQLFSYLH